MHFISLYFVTASDFFFRFGNWINISTLRMSRIHHDTWWSDRSNFWAKYFSLQRSTNILSALMHYIRIVYLFFLYKRWNLLFSYNLSPKIQYWNACHQLLQPFSNYLCRNLKEKNWQMFHCFVFLWLMSHREISSRLKTSSLPTQVFNEEEHSFACSYTSFEQMSANFTVLTLTHISL